MDQTTRALVPEDLWRNGQQQLAEHAAVIRALGKRVVGDIVEIGRRLTLSKDGDKDRGIPPIGHGNWLPWIEREFGWTEQTALNFMRVYELGAKSKTVLDLDIPVRGLYLLAAPSTPDEAREAVIERAQNGEALSLKEVQGMIAEARDKEAAAAKQTVTELKAEAKRREESVRAEYAGKVVVSPEKLAKETEKAIAAALKPLQQELEKAERKLEAAEKRLKGSKPNPPNIDPRAALASTGVQMALTHLIAKLDITPEQVIDIETRTAKATKQTIAARLGKTQNDAKRAVKWLNNFISLNLGDSK